MAEPESKSKDYFSRREFEQDRSEMWAEGWVIAEKRTTQGKTPMVPTGSLVDLLFLPIVWLFNRTQPKSILHVRYVRKRI